jgi:hypothetical protein
MGGHTPPHDDPVRITPRHGAPPLKRSSPSSRLRGALVAVALTVAGASVTHARRGDAQTPPAAADTYAIQLQRPVSVGDRARLVLEGEKGVVTRIVANGRPPTCCCARARW